MSSIRRVAIQTKPKSTAERWGWLIDEFVDSWLCWREACQDARSAYESWRRCEPPERGLTFASYRAALDREEQAARMYSARTERLRASPHL